MAVDYSIFDDDFIGRFISDAVDDFIHSVGWDNSDQNNTEDDND